MSGSVSQFINQAKALAESVNESYIDLGGVLAKITETQAYKHTTPVYDTFEEFCYEELGFTKRKAYYLISIHNSIEKFGLSREDLEGIGWTAAREIFSATDDEERVREFIEKAREMSVGALKDYIAARTGRVRSRDEDGDPAVTHPDGETLVKLTFWLTPEQKETFKQAVSIAKSIIGTDSDGVAIDMICVDYMTRNHDSYDLSSKLAEWSELGLLEIVEDDE
jgi:hypothetical protein